MSRLKTLLESRQLAKVAVALGCVLSLPSLRLGLVFDDLWHRAKMGGGSTWQPSSTGTFSLFAFASGKAEEHTRFIEQGFLPWWITPGLRLSFFRPIACLTHALDYALWPHTPALMHLQSVLWYAALLVVTVIAYRRFLPPLAANIAILFYAIDPTHALPASWVANRNALVATTFALAALALWDAKKHLLAALALALALGSGESAVAVLGFFVAHWLFIDRRPLRHAVPLLLVFAAWFIAYRAGRHGVIGSGIYTDPMRSPVAYVQNVVQHMPLLLASELGAPVPDPFPFLPLAGKVAFLAIAVAFVVCTAVLVRRLDPQHQRTVRFLGVGSVLAVLPGSATFPSGRLLLVAGFGLVGLVALVCAGPALPADRTARLFRGWAWIKHGALAPLLFVVGLHDMNIVNGVLREAGQNIPVDGSAADKRLVLFNAPDTAFAYYLIVNPLEDGLDPPKKLLVASGNQRDVRLTRTGERSFSIHEDGGFYRSNTEILFRDPRVPFAVGDRVEQSDTRLTITHVLANGTPDEATIDLTRDLAEGYVFMAWKDRTLVPFTLPPLGESVSFPGRLPSIP